MVISIGMEKSIFDDLLYEYKPVDDNEIFWMLQNIMRHAKCSFYITFVFLLNSLNY